MSPQPLPQDPPVPAEGQLPPPPDPVLNTPNTDLRDGVNRCPRCGSTEIQLRPAAGLLICLFCRHEWSEARVEESIGTEDLSQLRGTTVASGASDIDASIDSIVTMKCGGCGAEVVVNTQEQMSSRCHWCRHVLTVNEQIANGAVPDAVLPFSITHQDAVERIKRFAGKRRMFAHRQFRSGFAPENVVGVYMPYMVVDGNVSADVWGHGEVLIRKYTRGNDDDKETLYDADVYQVHRHVDFTVDDLTIESSVERGTIDVSQNTNNIINAVLPFDTKNAVQWNASYLTGFTSEKRDQDVSHLEPVLQDQLLSIGRSEVEQSVRRFDRGVRWEQERVDVHGTKWVSMYLPVWLYSYYHQHRGRGMVHYIAVNGRTGETMGSIPVSHPRLLIAALATGTVVEGIAIAILLATA